jgi:dihydroorotase-like cyclic amidohydrolase
MTFARRVSHQTVLCPDSGAVREVELAGEKYRQKVWVSAVSAGIHGGFVRFMEVPQASPDTTVDVSQLTKTLSPYRSALHETFYVAKLKISTIKRKSALSEDAAMIVTVSSYYDPLENNKCSG